MDLKSIILDRSPFLCENQCSDSVSTFWYERATCTLWGSLDRRFQLGLHIFGDSKAFSVFGSQKSNKKKCVENTVRTATAREEQRVIEIWNRQPYVSYVGHPRAIQQNIYVFNTEQASNMN
jgi:hypothetical protein